MASTSVANAPGEGIRGGEPSPFPEVLTGRYTCAQPASTLRAELAGNTPDFESLQ
jgi:hypothetical protein